MPTVASHHLAAKLTCLVDLGALALADISTARPQVPHVPTLLTPLLVSSAQMQPVNMPLCFHLCGGYIMKDFLEEVAF